jgi:hypothetical protein
MGRGPTRGAVMEGSGVWYCRQHAGLVNEDDPHDNENEDPCPWADLDDLKCRWVELLIPPVEGEVEQVAGTRDRP